MNLRPPVPQTCNPVGVKRDGVHERRHRRRCRHDVFNDRTICDGSDQATNLASDILLAVETHVRLALWMITANYHSRSSRRACRGAQSARHSKLRGAAQPTRDACRRSHASPQVVSKLRSAVGAELDRSCLSVVGHGHRNRSPPLSTRSARRGRRRKEALPIDVFRERLPFNVLEKNVVELKSKYKAKAVVVPRFTVCRCMGAEPAPISSSTTRIGGAVSFGYLAFVRSKSTEHFLLLPLGHLEDVECSRKFGRDLIELRR